MDCEYLKALTDLFATAESEEKVDEVTSATQNNGSCNHIKSINVTSVKTSEMNPTNQYTPSEPGNSPSLIYL